MAHNKKYSEKTVDSSDLVLRQNKINFTYSDKVCETFRLGSQTWQALKTNQPSCGWLTSFFVFGFFFFFKLGLCWMYFAVVGRKLGDKWLTLMNYTSNTESQKRSIRGLSAEHKLKRSTTVHCDSILRKDLKKFPCELQIK